MNGLGETRLLLDCLTGPGANARQELDQLGVSGWEALLEVADRHGVQPLLYERLAARGGGGLRLPTGALQRLRDAFLINGARNQFLYEELARVLTSLQQDGIRVIVLKGAHLAELVYANRAVRPMQDIDLFLPRAQLARAAAKLRGLGYTTETEDPAAWVKAHPAGCHLPGFLKPPHPRIEVHWRLDLAQPAQAEEGLCGRAQPAAIAGVDTRVLSPEDLLLHLCLHACHHVFDFGLGLLCDIAVTVQRHSGEISWEQVCSGAAQWQAERRVYTALRLAKELAKAPVPEAVLNTLDPGNGSGRWFAAAAGMVMAGPPAQASESGSELEPLLAKVADLRTTASLPGKAKWLARFVIPTRGHMADYMMQRHSLLLTPLRSYTCYLTRAVDLLGTVARLAWSCPGRNRGGPGRLQAKCRKAGLAKWLDENRP